MATRAIEQLPVGRLGRPAARRRRPAAVEEIRRTDPRKAPLPDPEGLAHSLSPVDLPVPAVPLPHPLRWTSEAILVAVLFLALFNAHALRSWSYQLAPNDTSAKVVTLAETWYGIADRARFNRPVETMHAWWQSGRDARFRGEKPASPRG